MLRRRPALTDLQLRGEGLHAILEHLARLHPHGVFLRLETLLQHLHLPLPRDNTQKYEPALIRRRHALERPVEEHLHPRLAGDLDVTRARLGAEGRGVQRTKESRQAGKPCGAEETEGDH